MGSVLPIFFVVAAGLCVSLVLFALWQSLRFILVSGAAPASADGPHNAARAALLHEKQELLTAIRDVRSEHELGKVSDADSEQLEQRYRARAREVLRELDEQLEPHRGKARALIEQALASSRGGAVAAPSAAAVASSASRDACAKCATANEPDAVFCKKCGTRLRAEAGP
jgi:hypothetical protein